MANASIRYQTYIWILDIINRSEGISLEQLNAQWVCTSLSDGRPFPRQTFVRYLAAIEEMFDIIIECDRSTNTYHIQDNKHSLRRDNTRRWMLNSMTMTAVLRESRGIQDRIVLEQVPSGGTYLIYITRAMEEGRIIHIRYQKFLDSAPYEATLVPYCLKLFRQRWYLLARRTDRSYLAMYALDRILGVQETDVKFHIPADFDAERYFANMYGVYRPNDVEAPMHIRVRTYNGEWNYLRTLPLHASQTEVEVTEEYVDFAFTMYDTRDLRLELLSRGDQVEVLEPLSLREAIRDMAMACAQRYDAENEG